MVAIENKKGNWWRVALDANGMAYVLQALEQYQAGKISNMRNKLPFTMVDPTHSGDNR